MKKHTERPTTLCLVSYPLSPRIKGWIPLGKLLGILEPLFSRIFLITGNLPEGEITQSNVRISANFRLAVERQRDLPAVLAYPIWLWGYIRGQIILSYNLLKTAAETDKVLFFLGSQVSFLPVILAKLLGKQVITMVIDYLPESQKAAYGRLAGKVYLLLTRLNYMLSDIIMVETESTIDWCHMEGFRRKVRVGAQLPVDHDRFRVLQPYASRSNVVGYFGRLSQEKGVVNFVKAIPEMAQRCPNLEFIIGGDGLLKEEIKDEISKPGLAGRAVMTGWIPLDELPGFLNRMKLLVHPSHTETGVASGVLEAMSCGTPVLLTAVGGARDVVVDGDNGFFLKDNSPEEIAAGVTRVLGNPDLERISRNARTTVEENFTVDAVRARYRSILGVGGGR
ncbi:MAG: glycosyltransferase [Chloroflexi bacterium]|nr:glycosyltransferase [Chloroflexota bacterium]